MWDQRKCLVIAEIGANHSGQYETALNLILGAHWAKADAVKVQMFRPEQMTFDRDDEKFIVRQGIWKGRKLMDLYQEAAMPYDWVPLLKAVAERLGMLFITSVYDPETVDIAVDMGIEILKIASFELSYEELVKKVSSSGKELIFSTGAHDQRQVWKSIQMSRQAYKRRWLLHCVSHYPTKPEECNLKTIRDLGRYNMGKVGFSDHTEGIHIAPLAVAHGARIIEKHIKLNDECLDYAFSITPDSFRTMVQYIRDAESSTGRIWYDSVSCVKREYIGGKYVRTATPCIDES